MSIVEFYNTGQLISSSAKEIKKKFTKTFDLSQIAEDPMDGYLDSLGLWKKRISRDGSCLFRAVAEQIYPCQQYHQKVRLECVNYMSIHRDEYSKFLSPQITFDDYLIAMKNPQEYAGQLEIAAMSKLYKRDFIIYQHADKPGSNATQNNYINKIYLCYSFNNHFDAIFSKKHRDNLAFIQSLVYEILYDKVFGSGEQINIARRLLRKSDTIYPKEFMKNDLEDDSFEMELVDKNNNALLVIDDLNVNTLQNNEDKDKDRNHENYKYNEEFSKTNSKLSKRIFTKTQEFPQNDKNLFLMQKMPLPYKVAKSLDPLIYRNTAFDAWLSDKKEYEEILSQKAIENLKQGEKCFVKLNDKINEKWNLAHVQNILKDSINVFLPELNEHHSVTLDNVKPLHNFNDLSMVHKSYQNHQNVQNNKNSNISILNSSIGNIQNVQKLVQPVNTEFSKIFLNLENKRKNLKKKQMLLKKSSSFHTFSADLPTLVEAEEQNNNFLFFKNQLYKSNNSYLRTESNHYPSYLVNNQETNHNVNHFVKSHRNNHYLNNNYFSLPSTQQNNFVQKNDYCSTKKTNFKMTSSVSSISSLNLISSINNISQKNNNANSKNRRQNLNQTNNHYNPVTSSKSCNALESQNNKGRQNNQIFVNMGQNPPSIFGSDHNSFSTNQVLPPSNSHLSGLNSNFDNSSTNLTAPLVGQPGLSNFLPPLITSTNLHHSNVNQHPNSIAPPPLAFINHPSRLSQCISPQTIHHNVLPLSLCYQQLRPNYFNQFSAPFMIPSFPWAPATFSIPHPQNAQTYFETYNDSKKNPCVFPNAANISTGNDSKNSPNSVFSKNTSFSYSLCEKQRKTNDNVDSFLNKDLRSNSKFIINNVNDNQQRPHNQSTNNINNISSDSIPSTNTSNYLLMPAPPSSSINNSNQSLNNLTRSQSYHSGITNSPYDKNQSILTNNNLNTDFYIPQSNQHNIYHNLTNFSSNIGNNINPANISLSNNDTGSSNNMVCSNSNTLQQYSNVSNGMIGFENFNLTYNGNRFSSYEMQYSRLENLSKNSNYLTDDSFVNSDDNRKPNKLNKPKNCNIFSDMAYGSELNQGNFINAIPNPTNHQFYYSNCFVVNIDGPINFNSTHSLLDDGSDLPLNDVNTMRFFYNLGIEYYRLNLPSAFNQSVGCYSQPPTSCLTTSVSNTNSINTLLNISSNQMNTNIKNSKASNSLLNKNCNIQQDQNLNDKQNTTQQVVPNSVTSSNNFH